MALPRVKSQGWGAILSGVSSLTPTVPTHASGDLIIAYAWWKSSLTTVTSGMGNRAYNSGTGRHNTVDWQIASSGSHSFAWSWTGGTPEGFIQYVVVESGTFDATTPFGTLTVDDPGGSIASGSAHTITPYTNVTSVAVLLLTMLGTGGGAGAINAELGGGPRPASRRVAGDDARHGWYQANTGGADRFSLGGWTPLKVGATSSPVVAATATIDRSFSVVQLPVRGTAADTVTTESFTGTNGDPWDIYNWASWENQDTTSWVEITSNRGRFESKNVSGRISTNAVWLWEKFTNYETTFDLVMGGTNTVQDIYFWIRGSGGFGGNNRYANTNIPVDGIGFRYRGNAAQVVQVVASSLSTVGSSVNPGHTGANTYSFRVVVTGERLQVRWWLSSGGEPGTWNLDETISGGLSSGWFQMATQSNSATAPGQITFDNFVFTAAAGTTPIGDEVGLSWNVQANSGDQLQALWDVTTPIGDEVQHLWDVTTPVGDQVEATWDIAALAADSVALVWDVESGLTVIGDEVALVWDLAAFSGDELSTLWDVTTPVGDPLGLLWNVTVPVNDQLALEWNLRAFLGDQVALRWNVTTPVNDQVVLRWDVQAMTIANATWIQSGTYVLAVGDPTNPVTTDDVVVVPVTTGGLVVDRDSAYAQRIFRRKVRITRGTD